MRMNATKFASLINISLLPTFFNVLVVLERKNIEEATELIRNMGRVAVHIPRPVPTEVIKRVDRYVERYYMPPSTWKRLAKGAKEIVKGRVEIVSRRGRFAESDIERVAEAIAMYRAGASIREVAKALGIPKSSVHYMITKGKKIRDGNVKILVQ